MPRAVAVLLCKAVPRQAGWVALLLAAWVLLGGSRVAQAYPAPCSLEPHNQMYAQSTPFVTAPAFVAGCVGMVPGALLGGWSVCRLVTLMVVPSSVPLPLIGRSRQWWGCRSSSWNTSRTPCTRTGGLLVRRLQQAVRHHAESSAWYWLRSYVRGPAPRRSATSGSRQRCRVAAMFRQHLSCRVTGACHVAPVC